MPEHAVGLKKYLGGIEILSTTCHKNDSTPALGDAEILGVEQPPRNATAGSRHTTRVRPPSPWRFEWTAFAGQCAQETSEGIASVAKDTWYVFPDVRCRRAAGFEAGLIDGICELHVT